MSGIAGAPQRRQSATIHPIFFALPFDVRSWAAWRRRIRSVAPHPANAHQTNSCADAMPRVHPLRVRTFPDYSVSLSAGKHLLLGGLRADAADDAILVVIYWPRLGMIQARRASEGRSLAGASGLCQFAPQRV